MTLLALEDVACHFTTPAGVVRAVDGITLKIDPGETLALVGESGCGKSTLAWLILGLHPLTRGRISFKGQDISRLRGRGAKGFRARVQAVFQDPYSSLNPRLKVRTILAEPLLAHGAARRGVAAKINRALSLVGLPEMSADLYPHEFSGGQRQRIAIARALILEPDLVVLDEPISALDVSIRAQMLNLLQDLQGELGLAYLLIAHDLALVEHAARRVAVMYLGEIVEDGRTEALFDRPQHPYTQALLAAVPRPDPAHPRATGQIHGEVATALAPPSGCRFHPRCPKCMDVCTKTAPETTIVATEHQARCHLLDSRHVPGTRRGTIVG
ncbi:MAG: ATP-binding cassette domain-containing protein [Gammaproteobacteria bacterium]|nr:ATP-binding cassette domain-containing protein [Gammaproteobacteria bacterium]